MADAHCLAKQQDRLLELSRQAQGKLPEDGEERQRIVVAAELLGRLLLQDVERTDDGVSLRHGMSRDRTMSVHDPEMHRSTLLPLQDANLTLSFSGFGLRRTAPSRAAYNKHLYR